MRQFSAIVKNLNRRRARSPIYVGGEIAHERRSPALVVTALAPVLRGRKGRNSGDNDVTATGRN
jgi:hypothetical protein